MKKMKEELKQFDFGFDYITHLIFGKVSYMELLDKALNDVNKYNDKFRTMV